MDYASSFALWYRGNMAKNNKARFYAQSPQVELKE